ncbi:hypothetical protein IAT40_004300 [Kwoniella sp. CBS 6097]
MSNKRKRTNAYTGTLQRSQFLPLPSSDTLITSSSPPSPLPRTMKSPLDSPTTLQDFPSEVVSLIFSLITNRPGDLFSLLLVDKAVYGIFVPRLYRSVSINKETTKGLFEGINHQLSNWFDKLEPPMEMGEWGNTKFGT